MAGAACAGVSIFSGCRSLFLSNMMFTAIVLKPVDGAVVFFQCLSVTSQTPNVSIISKYDNGLKRFYQDEY
jgi:hypothetical protein